MTSEPYTFKQNWDFQSRYYSKIESIIKQNAGEFISVTVADTETDMKRATDFVIKVTGGDIAVRIRRADKPWRDLTIRSYNNGYKTEIHKLREGFGRFYLYCWENDKHELSEWVLVDLDKLRETGLLDKQRKQFENRDGTTCFIAFGIRELEQVGCITAKLLNGVK